MAKKKEFGPSELAQEQPRAFLLDGSWVGIGGEILRTAKPPKLNTIIKEATADQYKKLADRCPNLVTQIS